MAVLLRMVTDLGCLALGHYLLTLLSKLGSKYICEYIEKIVFAIVMVVIFGAILFIFQSGLLLLL